MERFRISTLRSVLLLTPFLISCSGDVRTAKGAECLFNPIPCQEGDLIGVGADRTLTCIQIPPYDFRPQNCLDDQAMTAENGVLKCVNKGNGRTDPSISARVMQLQSQLNQIDGTVNLLKNGIALRSRFLGLSANTTTGRIINTTKVGLSAAAAYCAEKYTPAARMCTVYEMYEAVATGQITDNMTITKAWVYMAGWNNPANADPTPSAQEGDAGMNENCGSYRYSGQSNNWVGTAVAWQNMPYFDMANEKGLKFFSGSPQAACNMRYPIACCD